LQLQCKVFIIMTYKLISLFTIVQKNSTTTVGMANNLYSVSGTKNYNDTIARQINV